MTLNEFKYWLEGYGESFKDGTPSKEQWEKVKEKLLSISNSSKQEGILGGFNQKVVYPNDHLPPEKIAPAKIWYCNGS